MVLVLQLRQRVQLVSLLVKKPTAATHHTPPEARLRRSRSVVISWRADSHPDERSFQGVLTVALEQQPCGAQVVQSVGLVTSGFQFFTRLAAVFAVEVGGFSIGMS